MSDTRCHTNGAPPPDQKSIVLEAINRRANVGRRYDDGLGFGLLAIVGLGGLFYGILIGMSL